VWLSADPDKLLNAVATNADRAAFAQLFAHVAPKIKGFLMRATRGDTTLSDEMTQEVMLRVWRRAPSFDRSRGTAMGWIYGIASNARVDHFRRKRPEVQPTDSMLVDDGPLPDETVQLRQRAERVRQAVTTLPEAQAFVLEHAYFEGRTLAEIATATDTPLGTVKSRIRLAMVHLRETLEGQT
jgi:RNA polymerase sigma-70 factor (ECF subfamily)